MCARQVVAASTSRWVVVHLHAENSLEPQTGRGVPEKCSALVAVLQELAARRRALKCCQIPALEAIPPSQLPKLPALFCYRDGALRHSMLGAFADGVPSVAELSNTLASLGVLAAGSGGLQSGEDDKSDEEWDD